jgi:hypothetical protein
MRGIGRDVDSAFDEVWWFCPAGDVAWLRATLAAERPAHLVIALAGDVGEVLG